MWIKDNQQDISKSEFLEAYPNLGNYLLDKSLKYLSEHEKLFVFPTDLSKIPDLDESAKIFESVDDKVKSQNVAGFIGYRDEQLTIHSRFAQADDKDYFLHYMLQKVLHINLTNLDTTLSQDQQFYQLLVYLFPKYLQVALRKGLYKEYRRFDYHDANIKGSLDVARHIKVSTPFTGKIAYRTREFAYDNPLLQLVRHTIEYIKVSQKDSYSILDSNPETRGNVKAVAEVTSSYQLSDRQTIILSNQKKRLRHAYFKEYTALQQLCLLLLTSQKQSVGGNRDNIHGILFDVAWLWEEYIATLLGTEFVHPRNKANQKGISVFSSGRRKVYPDFYSPEKGIVLDAKYKRLELTEKGIDRSDLYQIVTYAYILKANLAGLVFPSQNDKVANMIGELAGYGAMLKKWSIKIPQGCTSYDAFVTEMAKNEKKFLETLKQSYSITT
ncbi:5-methylcytosine restriction system specificity protein McrC [Streptococcus rifensis]